VGGVIYRKKGKDEVCAASKGKTSKVNQRTVRSAIRTELQSQLHLPKKLRLGRWPLMGQGASAIVNGEIVCQSEPGGRPPKKKILLGAASSVEGCLKGFDPTEKKKNSRDKLVKKRKEATTTRRRGKDSH